MQDYIEVIIFVIFAAFSILSRFLNSKKKPPTRAPEEYRSPEHDQGPQPEKPVVDWERPPEKKPVTFEEILREMMGETKPRPVSPPVKVRDEAKKAKKKAKKKMERAKESARQAQRIADKISLEDSGKRIKPIVIGEQKNTVAQEVAEALSNPKSAREAIILSEIINRKYY